MSSKRNNNPRRFYVYSFNRPDETPEQRKKERGMNKIIINNNILNYDSNLDYNEYKDLYNF